MKNKIISLLILSVALAPVFVLAETITIDNPLDPNIKTLWQLIDKVIDFVFMIAWMVTPIIIIVSGFFFMTAQGEPEKILKAKKIILWALIGLLIVTSAKGLVALFATILGTKTYYN